MSKVILITGAGGQVGQELANADGDNRLIALTRQELDITDPGQISKAFANYRPSVVINAAAYTQVDRAEQEQELAYAINRDGVAGLARACQKSGTPLFHISTDYVFDGNMQGAYRETDPISPLGIYGKSKAEGEAVLQAILEQHIILRTSWVFSANGNNFVKTMLRLGKERDELGVVDDQRGCPTSARSIAEVLLKMAIRYLRGEKIPWGIYHYCNRPEITWFEFAMEIFSQANGYENLRINPIGTSDYPTPAVRPKNSVLDCSKLENNFGIKGRNWPDELGLLLEQFENQ